MSWLCTGSVGTHAFIVLAVTFGLVIAFVEAADPMKIVAARIAESIGESESKLQPVVVSGGNVGMGGFYALSDDFNVVSKVACNRLGAGGDRGWCRRCWHPVGRIESILCHNYQMNKGLM